MCSANILLTWKISANTQSRSDTNISHRTTYVWKSFCGTDLPSFDSRLKDFSAECLSSHMGNTTDPGLTWVIFYSVLCSTSYNVVTVVSSGIEGANQKDIHNLFQDALIQDLCLISVHHRVKQFKMLSEKNGTIPSNGLLQNFSVCRVSSKADKFKRILMKI